MFTNLVLRLLGVCLLCVLAWLNVLATPAAAADDPQPAAEPPAADAGLDSLDSALLKDLEVPSRPPIPAAKPPVAAPDLPLPEQEGAGEDLGQPAADPLATIGQRMRLAERLISRQETSQKTQQVQEQVIAELERLIEETKKQCQGGQGSPKAAPKPGAKPGGKGRAGGGDNAAANRPAKESAERTDSKTPGSEQLARFEQMVKQVWGHLPPKIRDQMQSGAIEEFLPKYERLIEEYYSRLAEEGRE